MSSATEAQAATKDNGAEGPKLLCPALSFETITFSDGQTLSFEEDDIIVFVGPNNAGKSAALRDLQHLLGRPDKQLVITATSLRKIGSAADLLKYLEQNAQRTGGPDQLSYAGMGYQIHHVHVSSFDDPANRHLVAPFLAPGLRLRFGLLRAIRQRLSRFTLIRPRTQSICFFWIPNLQMR